MNRFIAIECDPTKKKECSKKILNALQSDHWIQLLPHVGKKDLIPIEKIPKGKGIILQSSGSTGGPTLCFHTIQNLNQSAYSTAKWLKEQNLDPKECLIMNTLPLQHISGFMQWWRSLIWGSQHEWIKPLALKDGNQLRQVSTTIKDSNLKAITSLVPTQLQALLSNQDGRTWLKSFSLIWVGGALLSEGLAEEARQNKIQIAPCYGATETGAMVTSLSPTDFLSGSNSAGYPLDDIELKINEKKELKVKTDRLAIAKWDNEKLHPITDANGWWHAGDLAEFINTKKRSELKILGRKDNAINSGGETIFPENLGEELMAKVRQEKLPIDDIILIGINDIKWGEKLVALVRFKETNKVINKILEINKIASLMIGWAPYEKPSDWYECTGLTRTCNGKVEIHKWQEWVMNKSPLK